MFAKIARKVNKNLAFPALLAVKILMSENLLKGREVIIEFVPVGHIVRVSAMDTKTLTEIVIQGPASAGEEVLKRNAVRRLEYVLKKKGLI